MTVEKTHFILLVEDSAATKLLFRAAIGPEHPVVAVGLASDAYKELKRCFYSIVVLDIGLPDEDGFKVCEKIKNDSPATKVIFLTNKSSATDKAKGVSAGGDDYIIKPFTSEDLKKRIDTLLKTVVVPNININDFKTSKTPTADNAIIDQILAQKIPGGYEFFSQLSDLFIEEAQKHINQLLIYNGDRLPKDLSEEAHALKSSSGNLGIKQMSEICQKLEDLGNAGDLTGAGALLTDLRAAFAQAKLAIRAVCTKMAKEKEAASIKVPLKNLSILVADDDPTIVKFMKTLLEENGYTVSAVSNGAEALEKLGRRDFDLVITDANMPNGMSGFELAMAMSKNVKQAKIPIILLTGRRTKEDVLRAAECGIDEYIVKPINSETILLKINTLLTKIKAAS